VALIDGTLLDVEKGAMSFKAPAKELPWKAHDRAQLVVAPKAYSSIEQLKQEVDQAKGAGKVEARCLQLGGEMKPKMTSDDGIDITWFDPRKQTLLCDASITWKWDIGASSMGRHPLFLNATEYVQPPEGGSPRLRSYNELLAQGYINVSAPWWVVFTDFIARRWPELATIFLTILTAILIPFVIVPWWRRRHQPSEPRDRSSAPGGDRWI